MNKILIAAVCIVLFSFNVQGQEFVPLWPEGKMPNSKGYKMKDSIANERIYRVGTPGFYAFFPSKTENKGAAVLICPGGGYERLAYVISGTQLAKWFNSIGINAFVLNYRLPNSPDLRQRETGPLQDAQRAIKMIRANAKKWRINTDKIGIQGSSAGGHLAALTSVATEDMAIAGDSVDRFSSAVNFSILVSPVIDMGPLAHKGSKRNLLGENPSEEMISKYSPHQQVSSTTAPSFLVHAFDDKSVSAKNSLLFYQALLDKSVPSSLHLFPKGGHSIALRNNPGTTDEWTSLCEGWMIEMEFIPKVSGIVSLQVR